MAAIVVRPVASIAASKAEIAHSVCSHRIEPPRMANVKVPPSPVRVNASARLGCIARIHPGASHRSPP